MKPSYEFGFSFAGEDRALVKKVAKRLRKMTGVDESTILYDFARRVVQRCRQREPSSFLAQQFGRAYFSVVFCTPEYIKKHNTTLEWTKIRQRRHLLLTLRGAVLPGSGIHIPIDNWTAKRICKEILRHYFDALRDDRSTLAPGCSDWTSASLLHLGSSSCVDPLPTQSLSGSASGWSQISTVRLAPHASVPANASRRPHLRSMVFGAAAISGAVAAFVAMFALYLEGSTPDVTCRHAATCDFVVHTTQSVDSHESHQHPVADTVAAQADHPLLTQPVSAAQPPAAESLRCIDLATHHPPAPEPR